MVKILLISILFILSCSNIVQETQNAVNFAPATTTACNYENNSDGEIKTGVIGKKTLWGGLGGKSCVRMQGYVRVKSGAMLIIASGTTVLAAVSEPTVLIFERGSHISLDGRSDGPIIFTSGKSVGHRNKGDWGGIIINGNGRYNAGQQADGSNVGTGLAGTGLFGGNKGGNAGKMSYVRIEFAGKEFVREQVLAGLTLRAVGSHISVSHIHLHKNAGDGLSIIGGGVNVKFLIATENLGDQINWSNGWVGSIEDYILFPLDGDNGIEGTNNRVIPLREPISNPTLNNGYVVVPKDTPHNRAGLSLVHGTKVRFENLNVFNFAVCVLVQQTSGVALFERGKYNNCHKSAFTGSAEATSSFEQATNQRDLNISTSLTRTNFKSLFVPIFSWLSWTEYIRH